MNSEEARKLLEAERKERVEKAKQGIQEILNLYHCRLEPFAIIRNGQVIIQVDVLPNE